ncbi:hypothetical protein MRB53_002509 [Persea americana]|uniref:Uncharacterized protein n=1 Tax=Persea americana TaxID=3435 RepID=A0ACC2MUX7_PERAE|nr:hypothetical protein MRB53_002509 [Persea americana]
MIRVCFNPSSCDQAPQELSGTDIESTFGRVQLQLELAEDVEYLTKAGQVVLRPPRLNDHVINVNLHRLCQAALGTSSSLAAGRGKLSFGTGFIEVGEVHADPPFPRLLFDHHCVGQPLRIVDFFYCFYLKQLLDLLNHGLSLWDPSLAYFLDHGLMVGVHIQLMAHDCGIDAGHLVWCPCKDLFILEEEV